MLASGRGWAPSCAFVGGLGGVAPADARLSGGHVPAGHRRGGRRWARDLGALEASPLLLHPRLRLNRKVQVPSATGSPAPQQPAPLRTESKRTTAQPSRGRRGETPSSAPSRGLSGRPRNSSGRERRSVPLSKRTGPTEAARRAWATFAPYRFRGARAVGRAVSTSSMTLGTISSHISRPFSAVACVAFHSVPDGAMKLFGGGTMS
jgi:hypothetical protein